MSSASSFWIKRIQSLSGIFPIGVFLLQHLFGNSYAFISAEKFNEHSEFLTSLPMVYLIELGGIYFPILLHASLGLVIIYRGENNFTNYNYFRNWMFFFQRLTGVLALVFIATHSYTTRISSVLAGKEFEFADMAAPLAPPAWFWFYFVGVLAVVFHFCNGLWSFLVTWGITIGPKVQRVSSAATMTLFVFMGIWGISILLAFK